jgi:hydrogenase nickel incorporation protein HypA/HybF
VVHELSLTQNLLEIALQNAGEKRIVRVNLLMGELSDEREESIQFYWDDISKGTLAEMKCLECEAVFQPSEPVVVCPICEGRRLKLISGDDVRIESIDVE